MTANGRQEQPAKQRGKSRTPRKALGPDKRVSIFISHKVDTHQRAAEHIKRLLESRTERLDICICEEIPAGDRWRDWIQDSIAHSRILLVLLPQAGADITWLEKEIDQFLEKYHENGRLVILNHPAEPIPASLADHQIITTSTDQILAHFLQPLFRDCGFVFSDTPLNHRVTDADLQHDAEEIEQALFGLIDVKSQFYGESLVVETVGLDVTLPADMSQALVRAPNGCSRILNWEKREFRWQALCERAAAEKGKGTFWVTEMRDVITEVAQQNTPRVMTSTFRGRGPVAGQIFRPQLASVDFVGDRPARYHFFFHEVLVPELVRGPGPIGDVFGLLHIASRVRWEVLNPFVVKLCLGKDNLLARMDQDARNDVIGQVLRSLRIIEQEVERHQMLESATTAFEGDGRDLMVQLLDERKNIHQAIETVAQEPNVERFTTVLTEALELNSRAMELLANRFVELLSKDCAEVRERIAQTLPKTPLL